MNTDNHKVPTGVEPRPLPASEQKKRLRFGRVAIGAIAGILILALFLYTTILAYGFLVGVTK